MLEYMNWTLNTFPRRSGLDNLVVQDKNRKNWGDICHATLELCSYIFIQILSICYVFCNRALTDSSPNDDGWESNDSFVQF